MTWDSAPKVVIPEGLSESGPLLTNLHRPENAMAALEKAVYAILGHGAFQRRIMACSLLSMMVLLCHSLAYRAIASPVDHWCARPPEMRRTVTVQTWKNVAIPVEPDGSLSRCFVYDPPMPKASAVDDSRRIVSCSEWEYATQFRNRSIVSEWNLVCGRGRLLQLSSAAYMAGAMLGVPIAGLLSDRAGRKPVITGCVTALVFASVGCCVTRSFAMFVLTRMVVSATSSAAQVLSFILLYEVTNPEMRNAYALLATATGIMLMPVVLELVAAAELSWPATQLLLLVPTVSLVYSHYLLEESPSWLLATWRLKRAEEVLLLAARRNGLMVEKAARFFRKLKAEMRRHAHAYLAAASAAAGAAASDGSPRATLAAKKNSASSSLAAEFLSGWRAMSVFLAWFTVMFCYYGLMLADENRQSAHDELKVADVAYVLALVPVIAGTYVGMLLFGQRRTFILLLALLFESTAMLMVVPQDSSWAPTFLLKVMARAVTAAATSANYVYTAASFPTSVRSTGLTLSYASGRLGAIFATALMSLQVSFTRPFMNVTMMLLALVAVMVIQIAPEGPPKRRPLGSAGRVPAEGINARGRSFGWEIGARGSRDNSPQQTSSMRSSRSHSKGSSAESLMHGMPFDLHAWKIAAETVEP